MTQVIKKSDSGVTLEMETTYVVRRPGAVPLSFPEPVAAVFAFGEAVFSMPGATTKNLTYRGFTYSETPHSTFKLIAENVCLRALDVMWVGRCFDTELELKKAIDAFHAGRDKEIFHFSYLGFQYRYNSESNLFEIVFATIPLHAGSAVTIGSTFATAEAVRVAVDAYLAQKPRVISEQLETK